MNKDNNSSSTADKMRDLAFGKDAIEYCAPEALTPYNRNARTHDERQIEVLMSSIRAFGFVPRQRLWHRFEVVI